MTREDILKEIMERDMFDKDEYVILADGFEPAFVGVSVNKPSRVIYDYWLCSKMTSSARTQLLHHRLS